MYVYVAEAVGSPVMTILDASTFAILVSSCHINVKGVSYAFRLLAHVTIRIRSVSVTLKREVREMIG